jgi:hypothetical protein
MSNDRIHHKGDSKEHQRHTDSDDDAKQLSQSLQHSMKYKGSHHDSHHLHSSFNKHLPDLKITGSGGSASAEAKMAPDDTSDLINLTDKSNYEEARLESLSKKFGVKLKMNDGKLDCTTNTSGTDVSLGTYDNSPEGLNSLHSDLTKKVNEKKQALVKEYNVKFDTQETSPEYGDRAREPRLDELDALDSALKKSRSSLSTNFEQRILFLRDWREGDPAMQTQGKWNNRIVVYGMPENGAAVTSDQRSAEEKRLGILNSVEDTFLHEFGHVGDHTSGQVDRTKYGWQQMGNGTWAKKTTDDKLYIWNERKDENGKQPEGWVEVNSKGEFVHPDSLEGLISNSQMMEKALVKPSSDYFYTPKDDFAEGIARYRQSPESRAKLAQDAPELCKYVEEYDKREIADKLGVGEGNKPLYKRNEKFEIVRDESVAEKSTMAKLRDATFPYFISVPPIFYPL